MNLCKIIFYIILSVFTALGFAGFIISLVLKDNQNYMKFALECQEYDLKAATAEMMYEMMCDDPETYDVNDCVELQEEISKNNLYVQTFIEAYARPGSTDCWNIWP